MLFWREIKLAGATPSSLILLDQEMPPGGDTVDVSEEERAGQFPWGSGKLEQAQADFLGQPITLVGEWNGRVLFPLSALAEGRFINLN